MDTATAGSSTVLKESPQPIPIPELLWQASDGMMIIDESRRILAMNPTLNKWAGPAVSDADCGALLGCRDLKGNCLASRPLACPGLRAMRTHQPVDSVEYMIRGTGGVPRIVSASYTPIKDPHSEAIYTLVILRDITQSKHREEKLVQRALLDPLTGLYNRGALTDFLDRELKAAGRSERPCAIALIDVDGLKAYNDVFGHAAGDELLKLLARVFGVGHRGGEVIARYGGDEFVVVMPETSITGAFACGERIRKGVEQFPFHLTGTSNSGDKPVKVTVSIGIAAYPADGLTPQALLAEADHRLYRGKHAGKNRVVGPVPVIEQREHPRTALQASMVIRRQQDESEAPSHAATVTSVSMGGAYAVVSGWKDLKPSDAVYFSIRIPVQRQKDFPLSHLIGTGRIQRLSALEGAEDEEKLGMSVVFGDELVMVAAASL